MATPHADALTASVVVVDIERILLRTRERRRMRPSVAQVAALPVLPVEGEDAGGAHGHVPTVPTIAAVARPTGTKQIAENRRARHDYQLLDRFEAGIVLTGTEVKSLREGRVEFGGAYADVQNHDPDRDRKLLLHRREIASLIGKVREKGLTLVPTRLYFKDGKVKVELALARGKERIDKRRDLQKRDAERQIERALKSRR
jgi:SsrA-binding protein